MKELLKIVLAKMGLSADDYNDIFSQDLPELPSEVLSDISRNIITLESAKNNPNIKNHFKGSLFGQVDDKLKSTLNEFGIDDMSKLDGKDTLTRIVTALEMLKENESKDTSSKLKDKEEKLLELRKAIIEKDESYTQKTTQLQSKIDSMLYKQALNKEIRKSGLSFQIEDEEVLSDLIDITLSRRYEEIGGKPRLKGNEICVYGDDNEPLYDGANQITVNKDFLVSSLSKLAKKEPKTTTEETTLPSAENTRSNGFFQENLSFLNGNS